MVIINCSALAMWRTATSLTMVEVKATTKAAKQASFMTLVYHNLIYIVMKRLLSVPDSMIDKKFAEKLAVAKTEEQLEALVDSVITNQLQPPSRKGWVTPKLEDMELEIVHLVSYWNDQRVR